jgi:hypothetical protein
MRIAIVILLVYAWSFGMLTITRPLEPTGTVTERPCR